MTDAPPSRHADLAGLALAAAAVCCGVPLLVGAGSALTIFGVSLHSWILILAGAVVVLAGTVVARRRRATATTTDLERS